MVGGPPGAPVMYPRSTVTFFFFFFLKEKMCVIHHDFAWKKNCGVWGLGGLNSTKPPLKPNSTKNFKQNGNVMFHLSTFFVV